MFCFCFLEECKSKSKDLGILGYCTNKQQTLNIIRCVFVVLARFCSHVLSHATPVCYSIALLLHVQVSLFLPDLPFPTKVDKLHGYAGYLSLRWST